jgi:glucose/arabinose dehydrogenase
MRKAVAPALGALLALAALAAPAVADAPHVVVDGFHDVPLATVLDDPTAVRFASDGRMYVAEKWGPVLVFDEPQDPAPIEVINLQEEVNSYWDRGLLGMALDPDLGANGGHLYLLYSRDAALGQSPPQWHDDCPAAQQDDGCAISARLVRVTVGADGRAVGQPQVLIDQQWCAQFPSHSIGTVTFGPDGYLYVGAGDGASFNTADYGQLGANPCNDPVDEGGALRAQDVRTTSDPTGLDGSIIRVDPLTGARSIVAYGLRNPFRFTFRPSTSEIWLGDVGWNTWEEIDRFDPGGAAENFGWPCWEGNALSPSLTYTQLPLCKSLLAAAVTRPVFAYSHTGPVASGDGCGTGGAGSAISGLAFSSGAAYPAAYRGALFFSDVARNCLWFMRAGAGGAPDPATRAVFARGTPQGAGGPVDIEVAPNGNLVYVSLGDGGGQVREVRYSPLVARLTASTQYPDLSDDVTFNAGGSSGDGLSYEWDFGDGTGFHAGTETMSRSFGVRQNYDVRVRVTDAYGEQDVASVRISAGNTPPANPHISAQVPARGWAVGDHLHFTGGADDTPAPTYTWQLTIRHCTPAGGCHSHDISQSTGPAADFVAPDHPYPSKLWITLTATDDLGVTAQKRIELAPRTVKLTARATPAPLTVALDGGAATSATQTVIANGQATATTTSPQTAGGQTYRFMGWSDGDHHLTRTFSVRRDTSLVARFLAPPGAKTPPAIAGRARTRHTLTATAGAWLGNELTFAYQWSRCAASCLPIPGATARTYRPKTTDIGRRLTVRVTARNDLGGATQASAPTATVREGIPPKFRLARPKLRKGALRLRVRGISERCRVRATGVLSIKRRKAIRTKAATASLAKAGARTLTVRLSKPARRRVAAALRSGRAVHVRLTVTATDTAGNRSVAHRTVTLR